MRISVIGSGYVGLVSGACLAAVGHDCICVDVDAVKVDRINRADTPIYESGLDMLLKRVVGDKRLTASTDLHAAVLSTDVTFIAVGTPFDGQRIDLRFVSEAARQIGEVLREKAGYHVVVVKSTVVPGTTDNVVLPTLEKASGKRAGVDFGVGMNPEFLTEGVAVADFMHPDRIVLGGIDSRTVDVQRQVFAAFDKTPILVTNNKTAEMIKYTSNSVLATLISFSNEIGNVCGALGGVDVADVMRGVHLARYFTAERSEGRRAEAPITSFLWAGCGYGGSCLPKDTKALSAHAAANGQSMPLLDAVIETNRRQPGRLIELLQKHFPQLGGLRVAVLGLAFKEETDDMREAPSIPIIEMLSDKGAIVTAYDPVAGDTARAALPSTVTFVDSLANAIEGAQAMLLLTRWKEFRQLPQMLAGRANPPLVIDGRRMLERGLFDNYDGIGA